MNQDASDILPSPVWPDSTMIAAEDMRDTAKDRERYPLLAPLLDDCKPLAESYTKWDREAKSKLRFHSFLLMATAFFATLAVILAIYQLAGIESKFVQNAELFCAVSAGIAVLFGVWATLDHHWRLRRFQSEHSRLIKFGFLLNAAHWLQNREAGREYLRVEIERLRNLDRHAPEEWVLRKRKDINPPELVSTECDDAILRQLADYMRAKRIWYQAAYFKSESERRKSRERVSASLPVLLFALSLVAAIAHYFAHDQKVLATCLLLFAACLPVFAAGFRTVRGAMEYARNANRYYSLYVQLWELDTRISEHAAADDTTGQALALHDVELAMESEHRSWQRLMMEAEWFG